MESYQDLSHSVDPGQNSMDFDQGGQSHIFNLEKEHIYIIFVQ